MRTEGVEELHEPEKDNPPIIAQPSEPGPGSTGVREAQTGPHGTFLARHPTIVGQALLALVAGLNALLFFRHSILSGFARISADEWDGRIAIALLEHWYHVWRLQADWRSPIFFYPVRGTLGYGDAYFLYGAVYSLFRFLGADWFIAYELVNIGLKLVGFYGFFFLCQRVLGIRTRYAMLGASLFFQLNCTAVSLGHCQLLSINLAPILLILIHRLGEAFAGPSRRRVFVLGVLTMALYSSWLLSTFYMAWYFFLYGSCVAFLYILTTPRERWRSVVSILQRQALALVALVPFAMLVNVPFVVTYLPAARQTGMYPIAALRSHAGTPFDVINVGTGNLLYGQVTDWVHRSLTDFPLPGGERTTGITPLLLLISACGLHYCWRHSIGIDRRALRIMLLVLIALWIATFRVGGFLGWNYIFEYFPGGRAMRTLPRFQIFVGLFVVLIATIYLDRRKRFDHFALFTLLAALLLVEQVNTAYGWGLWRRDQNWVFAMPQPPSACRAFFVHRPLPRSNLSPNIQDNYAQSVDAMMVAEHFDLPTLNGKSSVKPRGWDLSRWQAPDYLDRVLAFAREQHVASGLCSLDIPSEHWTVLPAP